jgi:hypothetical protein
MGSSVVQDGVMLAGLVVQVVALCYLIKYVRATVGIQKAAAAQTQASQDLVRVGNEQVRVSQDLLKAANEQSEGLSRPVIVVESSPLSPSGGIGPIPGEGLFSQIGEGVRLVNVGTGPALWAEWSTAGQHRTGEKGDSRSAGFVPYLRPDGAIATECSRGYVSGLNSLTVECTYQSLGGVRYTSRTTVGDPDSASDAGPF